MRCIDWLTSQPLTDIKKHPDKGCPGGSAEGTSANHHENKYQLNNNTDILDLFKPAVDAGTKKHPLQSMQRVLVALFPMSDNMKN